MGRRWKGRKGGRDGGEKRGVAGGWRGEERETGRKGGERVIGGEKEELIETQRRENKKTMERTRSKEREN